jgi:hypothetical protein
LKLEGDFVTHRWLIPIIPVVAIALLVMAGFLRHLPRHMRPVLLTGLAVYAAGAIVLEGFMGFIGRSMAGGAWWDRVFFPASVAVEESLEFLGVIIVVAGIVAHLDQQRFFEVRRAERGPTDEEVQERTYSAALR